MATGTTSHRRVVAAGLVGNVLEWYDFAIYGFLAPTIGRLFFPSDDPTASLIAAFGAFAAGFLMRPVGGIVIGHIGDRFGRRRALTVSIALMAIPTFALGLMPTTLDIGVTAAVIVVLLRLAQGLSVGGEYTGSFAFLCERAPANRRNFFASWSLWGGIVGTLLGSGVAALVSELTTHEEMLAWGWRIPFLLGIIVALLGLIIRRGIDEDASTDRPEKAPIIEAATTAWPQLLQVAGLAALTAVVFYTVFIYAASWIVAETGMTHARALDINTISLFVILVALPLGGIIADRVGCRVLMIVAAAGLIVLAYPLIWLMHHHSFWIIVAGQAGIAFLVGTYGACLPVAMADLFPRHTRMSATGLAYNVTYAVLGGTAPVVAAWLVTSTGDAMAIAWYVILAAAMSLGVLLTLPKMHGKRMG